MEEFREALEAKSPRPWPLEPDFTKELMAQINEQTDRARNIVRSLLDFSRDREFKKESLSLKNLFEETIQFVKGQVPAKIGIALSVPDGHRHRCGQTAAPAGVPEPDQERP